MELADTSGDLEFALKLEEEERKFIEQARSDEALAREIQAKFERGEAESEEEVEEDDDEEAENRRGEAEEEAEAGGEGEEADHEEEDDDEEAEGEGSDEDILNQEPRIRRQPNGELSLEALLQQLGLRLDPRRVHFMDQLIADFENRGTDPFVLQQLPTRKYVKSATSSGGGGQQSCSICLAEFENDDEVTSLPCFHWFHKPEIDQWLAENNSCPICKNVVAI